MLCYNFARYYPYGNLGRGGMDFLCIITTAYESTMTLKNPYFKSIHIF